MGLSLSPRRKLFVAIGIGMVLSGPPVAALNLWLGSLAEHQSRDELDLSARRHMVLAEARIAKTIFTLDELASRNVDSCRASHVDALRQATFQTMPVKELSIVSTDGRTLSTDVGNQPELRKVVASEPVAADSNILLEVIHLGERPERWIPIRRPGVAGTNGIAALMPAGLFVPQVSTRGNLPKFHA